MSAFTSHRWLRETERQEGERTAARKRRMDYKWILTRGTDGDGRGGERKEDGDDETGREERRETHADQWVVLHSWFFTHCPDNGTSIIDLSLIRLLQGSDGEGRERNGDSGKMRETNISKLERRSVERIPLQRPNSPLEIKPNRHRYFFKSPLSRLHMCEIFENSPC